MQLYLPSVKMLLGFVLSLLLLNHKIAMAQQPFCGPALYEVLGDLCKEGYQGMTLPTKRFGLPQFGLDDDAILPLPQGGNSVFLDTMYGDIGNFLAKTRRRRNGIFYECCRKGCTLKEIGTYCSEKVRL